MKKLWANDKVRLDTDLLNDDYPENIRLYNLVRIGE